MLRRAGATMHRNRRRRFLIIAALTPLLVLAAFLALVAWHGIDDGRPSACTGTVTGGSLANGKRLPYAGENYRAFSLALYTLGRTFVRDAMADAYAALALSHPDLRFFYAETGWPWGGRFAPHKTHRNGAAVDFHVPVRDASGAVALLPTTLANHFGYEIEFDPQGRFAQYRLDFEAMAAHLLALEAASRRHGIAIGRVIFDVDLQPHLLATPAGEKLKNLVTFNRQQAWVRHDEHYHVDFVVPCAALPPGSV